MEKLCIKCKSCTPSDSGFMHFCNNPIVVNTLGKSRVTGETAPVHCHVVRSMAGMPCGLEGALWEPKRDGNNPSNLQQSSRISDDFNKGIK